MKNYTVTKMVCLFFCVGVNYYLPGMDQQSEYDLKMTKLFSCSLASDIITELYFNEACRFAHNDMDITFKRLDFLSHQQGLSLYITPQLISEVMEVPSLELKVIIDQDGLKIPYFIIGDVRYDFIGTNNKFAIEAMMYVYDEKKNRGLNKLPLRSFFIAASNYAARLGFNELKTIFDSRY